MSKIGAFDTDTFYPEKDRLKLAVALNNILAAPSFSTWIEGAPLDLEVLLSGGKKPRQLIFYLAHLEDTQRMFFFGRAANMSSPNLFVAPMKLVGSTALSDEINTNASQPHSSATFSKGATASTLLVSAPRILSSTSGTCL